MDMDSPANFYDTDFFGSDNSLDKNQKPNQVFLFESESAGFSEDIGGLYENEDSIDFSQYIHNSGEQPHNSNYDLLQFGLTALSTSPPKPHEFNLSTSPPKPNLTDFNVLPQLIKSIKPDPDGPYHDPAPSVSDIDTAPCTPAFTDSNPGSPRPGPDSITGEYMPQIGELQGGEALSSTGNYYSPADGAHQQQLTYQQEPSETASEPSSVHSSPSGSHSKGVKRSRVRNPIDKESVEYKEKRERNNIAVRKSRLKSKEKNQGLQARVDELTNENSRLNKRVELLTKELTVLKSLFTNVGKQPPSKLLGAISQ